MNLMNDKKLGFGLMRLPLHDQNDPKSIDIGHTCRMVDEFLARGFTYFDTAWMYCGFESENAIRKALVERHPRESYTLADKLHASFLTCAEDRDRIFNEQRAKTGVEYFDYYLIHDIGMDHYEIYKKYDCFNWAREKKAQGLIRQLGFSFHDSAEMLEKVLSEQPDMDFVQLQLNYLDWESEGIQSRKCYEVARRHGVDIIVMEPVKGGTLAKVPPAVEKLFQSYNSTASIPSWAIRFAAGLEGVKMVLSGMSNMEQLLDNTGYMADFKPLSDEEQQLVRQAVALINSTVVIPCTGCAYCVDGCPQNIAIPRYFSLYNADRQEADGKKWTPQGEYYERLTAKFGKAGDCIGCGQCEAACPQHLPVIKLLKEVAEHFEP